VKEVRIHLTAAQRARIPATQSREKDLTVSSRQDNTADLPSSPAPNDSSDLHGSGADLSGSGPGRPTGVIRPLQEIRQGREAGSGTEGPLSTRQSAAEMTSGSCLIEVSLTCKEREGIMARVVRLRLKTASISAAVLTLLLAARYEAATSSRALMRLPGAETTAAAETATSYEVLHSFSSESGHPRASLLQGTDGKLYGTTESDGFAGRGSVFVLTPDGTGGFEFSTLHSVAGGVGSDGESPYAGLIQATDGDFYGTTNGGGTSIYGTAFKIDASGNFTRLHSFVVSDGAHPQAGLIQAADGDFYGTTFAGGANGYGTLFRMDASGNVTTLHSFSSSEGHFPVGLIQATDGNFYGTTKQGGVNDKGTTFKMDASGNVTTVHSFAGSGPPASVSDGAYPLAGLIQATDGNFYGTTYQGGTYPRLSGTAFKMDASGNVTTLHAFGGDLNGENPYAGLIQTTDGNFYGTAYLGGSGNLGTVFKMDSSDTVTLLHSFVHTDGMNPYAGLL